ncbi:hypothetical protein [Pilimelia columellifera]|uniref:Protein phosphatase 2C domain-containing protein n=1 Tax=Pilimelia columellifera subsp. columellifera TaxID=706583 RepID=A0ABP6AKY0_9ACTN
MFAIATDGAPGRPNEDFVIATTDLVVVVDGAGIPFGGCSHGVAWYARQLGTRTLAALVTSPEMPLTEGLRQGLADTAAMHADTCDLTNPGTPCAAVGVLRIGAETVDTLALSDVTIVVETGDGPQITCDLAIEELNGTEPDSLRGMHFGSAEHADALAQLVARQTATRNRPDGWWVAAENPAAADYAHTRTFARTDVRRMLAISDGATRPVDQMGIYAWPEYLDLLDKVGPVDLLAHVRAIENDDPIGVRYSRTKRHDDATIAQFIG